MLLILKLVLFGAGNPDSFFSVTNRQLSIVACMHGSCTVYSNATSSSRPSPIGEGSYICILMADVHTKEQRSFMKSLHSYTRK